MSVDEPQTYGWRIKRLEDRLQRIEDQELHASIVFLTQQLDRLHDDLTWLKRTLVGTIFTLLGGMILFLVSVAAGWI
jgi:hypothetical protein